jgi:hypothetical protein
VSGAQTVKFGAVSGFATPASVMRDVAPGNVPTIVEAYYSDTSDPKDDKAAGAVSLTLKNVDTVYARRTLWENDPADHFAFAGADGNYYDFSLDDVEGDGVSFSITNAQYGVVAENVRSVDKLPLPKTLGKYYLIVRNADGAEKFGGYALRGRFGGRETVEFAAVRAERKTDRRVRKRVYGKDGSYVAFFGGARTQEFLPRRHVAEQILDFDERPRRTAGGRGFDERAGIDPDHRPFVGIAAAGGD